MKDIIYEKKFNFYIDKVMFNMNNTNWIAKFYTKDDYLFEFIMHNINQAQEEILKWYVVVNKKKYRCNNFYTINDLTKLFIGNFSKIKITKWTKKENIHNISINLIYNNDNNNNNINDYNVSLVFSNEHDGFYKHKITYNEILPSGIERGFEKFL
jgi:hypothetical protein